jgi:hypothetical protein
MGPYYAASIDEPLVGLYLLWALSISRQEFGHGSPSCVQVIHGEEMSCVEVLKSPSTGSRTTSNLASDRILAPGRLLGSGLISILRARLCQWLSLIVVKKKFVRQLQSCAALPAPQFQAQLPPRGLRFP